jgi:hypothetical protein
MRLPPTVAFGAQPLVFLLCRQVRRSGLPVGLSVNRWDSKRSGDGARRRLMQVRRSGLPVGLSTNRWGSKRSGVGARRRLMQVRRSGLPVGLRTLPMGLEAKRSWGPSAFDAGAPVRLAGRVEDLTEGLEAKRSWGPSAFDTVAFCSCKAFCRTSDHGIRR